MENIIEKLSQIEYIQTAPFKSWKVKEIKKLLELYLLISKKESKIFQLIYNYNGTDCYEDIFRDYNRKYLKDKIDGVQDAIDMINELSEEEEEAEIIQPKAEIIQPKAEIIQPQAEIIQPQVEIIKPSISTDIEKEIEDLIKLLYLLRDYKLKFDKYIVVNNKKYEINPELYDLLTTKNNEGELSLDNKKNIVKSIEFDYIYYINNNNPKISILVSSFSIDQLLKIQINALYVEIRKKEMEYYESLPPEYAEIFKNNNYDNIFEQVKDKIILQIEKLYEKQAEMYSKK